MGFDLQSLDGKLQSTIARLDENLKIFTELQSKAERSKLEFDIASKDVKALESDMKAVFKEYDTRFSAMLADFSAQMENMERVKEKLLSVHKDFTAYADKRIEDYRGAVNKAIDNIDKLIGDLVKRVVEQGDSITKMRADYDLLFSRIDKLDRRYKLLRAFSFISSAVLLILTIVIFLLQLKG
jgi:molybdopterin converting factor small subunit